MKKFKKKWRSREDSNLRGDCSPYILSRDASSTTWVLLQLNYQIMQSKLLYKKLLIIHFKVSFWFQAATLISKELILLFLSKNLLKF